MNNIAIIPEYSINGGGTLSFLLKLVDILKKNNNKITIIIERNKRIDIIDQLTSSKNITIFETPQRPELFYKPYFSVLYELWIWFIYLRKIKYDLIFVSNGTPWLNMGYILVEKKMIYFMHTYPVKVLVWKASLMHCLSKLVSKKKCVATVSEYSANLISKYMDINKVNIHVIYNSYNKQFENLKREIETPVVLTIGHVIDYKNPELWLNVAIKVIRKLPSVKFLWVGDGDMLDSMRELVKISGLINNIYFLGHSNQIADFYSKASVYFQPSRIENHSISVIEGMSASIPCVVSRIGGMTESVSDRINGFVCDVDDIELFSRRIIELLMNKSLANEYGDAGQKIAKEKFHESIQEFKIVSLVNRIIL